MQQGTKVETFLNLKVITSQLVLHIDISPQNRLHLLRNNAINYNRYRFIGEIYQ